MTLGVLKRAIVDNRPTTFDDCVSWGLKLFHEYFYNQISQLLYVFPHDHKTTTGQPFWSGHKRCPQALRFDVNDVSAKYML